MFLRKLAVLSASGALLVGIGFATAGAAGASPVPQGTSYSQYLAGHIATSNLPIDRSRIIVSDLPDLGSYTAACIADTDPADFTKSMGHTGSPTACASTVAIGVVLAEDSNGKNAYATALVWDAKTTGEGRSVSTCPSDEWTLEGGNYYIPTVTPISVIPINDLFPLKFGGGDQCFAPGSSQWFAVIESVRYHQVYFANGPSEANSSVSEVPFTDVHDQFYATGEGADVTSGVNATFLPTGTLLDASNLGLNVVNNQVGCTRSCGDQRITWDKLVTFLVTADQDGVNPPSLHNPETMHAGGFGGSSSTLVSVP